MDFQSIQVFKMIVETQSLSQAAKLLYVSQSTVSNRLKQLEDDLDAQLIVRNKGQRTIHLTPKGEEFISVAERWLALWSDTNNIKNTKSKVPLSIGLTDSLNTYVFPELYKSLIIKNSNLDLHIRTQHSLEIYKLLANHEIDAGFIITPYAYKNINIEPIFTEEMVLISKPGVFRSGEKIHPGELDCSKEIFTDWNPEIHKWHNFWFNNTVRARLNFNNPSLILSFIEEPGYWTIVPKSLAVAFSKSKKLQFNELSDPPENRTSYLITHEFPKTSSLENVKMLKEELHLYIQQSELFCKVE